MLFFASNLITVRFAHVTHITHITHTTRVTHILRITPNKCHSLLPYHNHLVTERQELHRVRRQHARSPSQLLPNALVEQSVAHARVHRRQRVVQQHNVRVGITAARQRNARLLPARHVDAVVANFRVFAAQQHQITLHLSRGDHTREPRRVERRAHQDVVAYRVVDNPRLLLRQSKRPTHTHGALTTRQRAQQRQQEGGLATACVANHRHQTALLDAQRHLLQTRLLVAPRERRLLHLDRILGVRRALLRLLLLLQTQKVRNTLHGRTSSHSHSFRSLH